MKTTIEKSLSQALAHHQAGRLDEAAKLYKWILLGNSLHPVALHYLGLVYHQRGENDTALDFIRRSIAADGKVADFHSNLGAVLKQAGELDEAMDAWRKALELRPEFPEAMANLGDALRLRKQFDESIDLLTRSAALRSTPETLQNLGLAYLDSGKPAQAVEQFRKVLAARPDDAGGMKNLGTALAQSGEANQGAEMLRGAVAIDPGDADAQFRLGNALRAAGDMAAAAEAFGLALELKGNNAQVLNNLGATLTDLARPFDALAHFRQAIELEPDLAEAHYNMALALLTLGDFANGLAEYEWRWKSHNFLDTLPAVDAPAWDGGDLAGKTILLRSEQGCGDAIQFIRYAPMLAERGATVVVECQQELLRLISKAPGVSRAVPRGGDSGHYDLQLPMLSLPLRLGTTPHTIPWAGGYLTADPLTVEAWKSRVKVGGLRCGLVWAGNPAHRNDRNRSISPAVLAPLTGLAGVTFFSLQKGATPRDLPAIDLAPELCDFAETAAVLASLDLVITVDTSVAHLAGAMGIETWMMVPFAPDWRWMLDSATTPWYSSLRLFRQQAAGDWEGVVRKMMGALYFKLARMAA